MKFVHTLAALASIVALSGYLDASAAQSSLNASKAGLMTIPVAKGSSCELLAALNTQRPLVRKKPSELNAFGFGTDCPKEIQTREGKALVVTFVGYRVFGEALVAYRPNGSAMKVLRNFEGRKRGFSGYRGFRYVFYKSPNG